MRNKLKVVDSWTFKQLDGKCLSPFSSTIAGCKGSRLGNDEYEMWAHMFLTKTLHVTLSLNSKLWDYLQIDIGCRIATEILES